MSVLSTLCERVCVFVCVCVCVCVCVHMYVKMSIGVCVCLREREREREKGRERELNFLKNLFTEIKVSSDILFFPATFNCIIVYDFDMVDL